MSAPVTGDEARVIALAAAAGKEQITLKVRLWSGQIEEVAFCGYCGRAICHPDCSRRRGVADGVELDFGPR